MAAFPGLSAEVPRAAELTARGEAGPVLVAIPAHNEARFIGSVVLRAKRYAAHVLVIDDGSTDLTAEIARDAGAEVVQHPTNLGKASAVSAAFHVARRLGVSALVLLDGDGQHSPEEIPQLLEALREDAADMVIGSRFLGVPNSAPRWRIFGQAALTSATNVASGTRVTDSQSGYRVFSRRAIEALLFTRAGFAVESEMQFLARQHGLHIAEVPVSTHYGEPMKRNPFAHGLSVLEGIVWLVSLHRPLSFFGLPGLFSLLAGVTLGAVVVHIYEQTLVLAVGYALITVLLTMAGLLSLFTGLTLHSIRQLLVQRARED